MSNFMNNFTIFFSAILSCLGSIWTWLMSSILGQIFIFMVLISIFCYIIYVLIHIGD